MTPTTRYLCPLPECGWHHDEPDVTASDMPQIVQEPAADDPGYDPVLGYRTEFEVCADPPTFTGLGDVIASLVEQAMLRRAARTEALIEAHVSTHSVLEWMTEVNRLQGILRQVGYVPPPATGPDHEQLSKICYARNDKGMLCDRKRGHDGERVDIYGPRGGTWAKKEPS